MRGGRFPALEGPAGAGAYGETDAPTRAPPIGPKMRPCGAACNAGGFTSRVMSGFGAGTRTEWVEPLAPVVDGAPAFDIEPHPQHPDQHSESPTGGSHDVRRAALHATVPRAAVPARCRARRA